MSARQIVLFLGLLMAGIAAVLGWSFQSGLLYGPFGGGLPADKADYAGTWREAGHMLVIGANGRVTYIAANGSTRSKITAPLQKFDGDSFTIGFLFWGTTFKVTNPPHLQGDVWRMTSDGVEYVR